MKINLEDPVFKVMKQGQGQKAETGSVAKNTFKDILEKVEESKSSKASDIQQPFQSQGISAIQPNYFPMTVNDAELRLEKLLTLIEGYQKKLEDPHAGMKEIYADLKKMEKEQGGLEKIQQGLDDGDAIKDIVNQALVLSSMEVFKFNSGHYLDE